MASAKGRPARNNSESRGGGRGGLNSRMSSYADLGGPLSPEGSSGRLHKPDMRKIAIEQLKLENSRVRDELLLEKMRTQSTATTLKSGVHDTILKLQDEMLLGTHRLEVEQRRVKDLDRTIAYLTEQILDAKRTIAATPNDVDVSKTNKAVENRLEKALVKFNASVVYNTKLRSTIDELRHNHMGMSTILVRLDREMVELRQSATRSTEAATLAWEARDAAAKEVAQLQAVLAAQQALFETQWMDLERRATSERSRRTALMARSGSVTIKRQPADREIAFNRKVLKQQWHAAKDKAELNLNIERVQSYEEAFSQVQAVLGITDVDELVTKFVEAEDANFVLYGRVNDLNVLLERKEDAITDLKAELARLKGESEVTPAAQSAFARDLESRLARTGAKTAEASSRLSEARRVVDALKRSIWAALQKVGADAAALAESLGAAAAVPTSADGVTESNMMPLLGVLELRANEIVQGYAAVAGAGARVLGESVTMGPGQVPALALTAQGPTVPPGGPPLAIEPPSTEMTVRTGGGGGAAAAPTLGDDDDDPGRPLSREEIRASALRSIARREEAARERAEAGNGGFFSSLNRSRGAPSDGSNRGAAPRRTDSRPLVGESSSSAMGATGPASRRAAEAAKKVTLFTAADPRDSGGSGSRPPSSEGMAPVTVNGEQA